jgi:Na+-driven multidrug efflux pump
MDRSPIVFPATDKSYNMSTNLLFVALVVALIVYITTSLGVEDKESKNERTWMLAFYLALVAIVIYNTHFVDWVTNFINHLLFSGQGKKMSAGFTNLIHTVLFFFAAAATIVLFNRNEKEQTLTPASHPQAAALGNSLGYYA